MHIHSFVSRYLSVPVYLYLSCCSLACAQLPPVRMIPKSTCPFTPALPVRMSVYLPLNGKIPVIPAFSDLSYCPSVVYTQPSRSRKHPVCLLSSVLPFPVYDFTCRTPPRDCTSRPSVLPSLSLTRKLSVCLSHVQPFPVSTCLFSPVELSAWLHLPVHLYCPLCLPPKALCPSILTCSNFPCLCICPVLSCTTCPVCICPGSPVLSCTTCSVYASIPAHLFCLPPLVLSMHLAYLSCLPPVLSRLPPTGEFARSSHHGSRHHLSKHYLHTSPRILLPSSFSPVPECPT